MKNQPLVSVICLCYNQNKFVERCLKSVFDQSYDNIELIIVDDGSTDGSKNTIHRILQDTPDIRFFDLDKNLGNTGAFNLGFFASKGDYIIDLAADDIMCEDRIVKQIAFFLENPKNIGVVYSDAEYVNEKSEALGTHFEDSKLIPFQGDVYEKVICTYFIPPPTMMIKRKVLEELNGYDATLSYEDFDFWIRSARQWHYGYQPEVLTKITKHKNSLSTHCYTKGDKQLYSTYQVCKKIDKLNSTKNEHMALLERLKYEIRQSVFSANHREAELFLRFLSRLGGASMIYNWLARLNRAQIDFTPLRRAYHHLRFG